MKMKKNLIDVETQKIRVDLEKNDPKSRPKKSLVTEPGSFTLIFCVSSLASLKVKLSLRGSQPMTNNTLNIDSFPILLNLYILVIPKS